MPQDTINLPYPYAAIFRDQVKGEISADAGEGYAEIPDGADYEAKVKAVEANRAILDQIGWDDGDSDGAPKDVQLTADYELIRFHLERSMDTVSSLIAEAVGEYRKDKPIDTEVARRIIDQLVWLIDAWELQGDRVDDARTVAV
jgi:hypothetical protein